MRSNGWEKPVHYLQLITWIFFPTIMLLFFVCYIPLLSTKTAIISGIVYGILCMIVVYAVYRCTGTNPADDSISRTSNVVTATTVGDDQVYCNVCLHYVHKESRHCRLCDKCVEVFDHHCKWLNNCVGKKNYHFFLSSVVSTTTLLSIQAVLGIYLFYTVFHNPDVIRRRSASVFGCSNRIDPTTGLCRDGAYTISIQAIKIIHALLLAVVVPWWLLLAQLTLFHFQLCYEKITTYDYIVRKRKRKLQQERENAVRRPFHLRFLSLLQCQCKRLVYESPATPISGKSCNSHIESETKDETIEVQVDDDLEILSVTSEDDGRTRSFQARTKQEKKGFGKYVELGGKPTNGTSTVSTVVHTPLALDPDAPFLVAPITPQSPRSDPSSAYHSEVSEPDERTTSTSVVMYGRMSTKDREMNHIV